MIFLQAVQNNSYSFLHVLLSHHPFEIGKQRRRDETRKNNSNTISVAKVFEHNNPVCLSMCGWAQISPTGTTLEIFLFLLLIRRTKNALFNGN